MDSIEESRFRLPGRDGAEIAAYRWLPAGEVRAVLQVAHGMGEHAQRYLAPLRPLIASGVAVYTNDHRGHGQTAASPAELGDFGAGGFESLVDDMLRLTLVAMAEYPRTPRFLLGHSMGSFAAQSYAIDNSALIDGLVLSGSAALDLLLAAAINNPGGLEAFNAPFEPARTPFDWLSREPRAVDAYIADPLCGFSAQPESLMSMFALATRLGDASELRKIRPDLPIYLFAGDADPINSNLTALQPLVDRYRAAGLGDLTCDFYPQGRHEMLNEINRDEVVGKLAAWMDRVIAASPLHKEIA